MKSLFISISLFLSLGSFAQQLSFDFGHADEILQKTFHYPGDEGVSLVSLSEIPDVVKKELAKLDVAFELADGYYDYLATALYSISHKGKVIGYMECALLSYTEDTEISLTGVKFNLNGRRVAGFDYNDLFIGYFDSVEEARSSLPKELQP